MSVGDTRFQACLFDLYDTLVYLDERAYSEKNQNIARLIGVPVDNYTRAWKSLVEASNLGMFPRTQDRAIEVLRRVGVTPDETVAERVALEEHQFLREGSFLYQDTKETLTTLRRCHVRCALVTNASPSVWEVIASKELTSLLDEIVVSSQVGIRKPEPGIYTEAMRRLRVRADQSAFIGDGNDRELEGAKAVGLTTIRIDRGTFRAIQTQQSAAEFVDFVVSSLAEVPAVLGLT